MVRRPIEHWTQPRECCDSAWEAAYARFESRATETAKFLRRLRWLGADHWPRDLRVVELFCGRGNGLDAWHRLGFGEIEGVDISKSLLERYLGDAQLYVGDCRRLGFADASRDIICVQGGLHHLLVLPDDLQATVAEAWRVLKPDGRMVVVEPWATPFLAVVHRLCRLSWARRASRKLDSLACMIEHEQATYFNWLARGPEILGVLTRDFQTESKRIAWGKLSWLGRKAGGRSG
jgi:ubiquinone/menaquinone biosynthesis C-methylase UbiE